MKTFLLENPFFKNLYTKFCELKVFNNIIFNFIFFPISNNNLFPKLFFAGARKGDIGGPYLKIKKLNNFFPEHKWDFNIVYILSNSPYLTPSTLNLIKIKNLPLILNQNGVFYPSWYKGNWKKQNSIISRGYHSADYIFWQSNFCRNTSDKFLGKRSDKGEILFNSVDTKKFFPKQNKYRKIFKLLTTGNIRKNNNYRIQIILDSIKGIIKINKNVHLYIAGYVEDLNYFVSEIERLKIRNYVTFLGNYSQEDAPHIYQMADAYITMSYQDNCPSAVIEAMSCGLPILYSSSGGVPELVGSQSGIGLKVPRDWEKIYTPDPQKIVDGFTQIIERRKEMSESARFRAVKLFDIQNWIERHNQIFNEILSKGNY